MKKVNAELEKYKKQEEQKLKDKKKKAV